MKKSIFFILYLNLSFIVQAVTIQTTPGGLSQAINKSGQNLNLISELTLTGEIDARDFRTIRYYMPELKQLDLTNVNIVAYSGTEGTLGNWDPVDYAANEIPQEAFYFLNQTSITIPTSVTSIGAFAFYMCTASIVVPVNNTVYASIDGVLFNKSKTNLIHCPISKTGIYIIPTTVTIIEYRAFSQCSNLTSIIFHSALQSIGESAFSGCTSVSSLTIPASVTSIGNGAFGGCNIAITLDGENPAFSLENGLLFNKSKTLLLYCPTSKNGSFTIPTSVTSIGDGTFMNCSNLTEIIIPSTVSSIGANAFSGCSKLTAMDIPSSVTLINTGTFSNCPNLASVNLSSSVDSIGSFAFTSCTSLTSFAIPPLVKCIAEFTFQRCSNLRSITVPPALTYIGGDAFSECTSLTSIDIPSTVKTIKSYAFSACTSLVSLTLPIALEEIERNTFSFCINLTTLTMPSAVKSIGDDAFKGCQSLTNITIPASVSSIGYNAFTGCSSLKKVYSYRNEPVVLNGVNFRDADYNCELHVPVGFKAAYESTVGWDVFRYIIEDLPTFINDISTGTLRLNIKDGVLGINNIQQGERVTIFNIEGQEIFSDLSDSKNIYIKLPAIGIYIVKVGFWSQKIIY